MTKTSTPSVCIVGAGSMGVSTGYHLSLAGAAVTFLVRPHRQEQLSRPQVLYSYDDHSLKTFSGVLSSWPEIGSVAGSRA
jgi:ketopantoate reductase